MVDDFAANSEKRVGSKLLWWQVRGGRDVGQVKAQERGLLHVLDEVPAARDPMGEGHVGAKALAAWRWLGHLMALRIRQWTRAVLAVIFEGLWLSLGPHVVGRRQD